MQLHFNQRNGFSLSLPASDADNGSSGLPSEFVQSSRKKRTLYFTSKQMLSLNARLQDARDECIARADALLANLWDYVGRRYSAIGIFIESLSLLDLLGSFACTVASSPVGNFVRPSFTATGATEIKNGRHPIFEDLLQSESGSSTFVANSTTMNEGNRVIILSGANSSGKTTYLKQIAILQVLACTGCFVPCESCNLRIVDSLYTRLSSTNCVDNNTSTFLREMLEASTILRTASARSLVIIDELGRATSNREGTALAWAICESLVQRGCFTVVATHLDQLSNLHKLYPAVTAAHMVTESTAFSLSFKFRVDGGPNDTAHYGIALAKYSGLPSSITHGAEQLLKAAKEAQQQSTLLALPTHVSVEHSETDRIAHRLLQSASRVDALRTAGPEKDGGAESSTLTEELATLQELAR
jgi:DNA mismatch repair protein MSH4